MSDAAFLTLIGAVFFAGGFVKGGIGLGLPTVVMGLLSITMPPAQAAAMVVIPAMVTNIWQMSGPALFSLLRRLAPMVLGVAIGTFATIGFLTGASHWATAALGAVLAIYGILGFFPRRFIVKPEAEAWLSPTIGLINGGLSGATGVFVVPGVPYLDALRMERDTLIQAIGIHAFVCPSILALALLTRGQLPTDAVATGATALLPALAGMYVGQRIRRRLHPDVFRRWFFAGLIGLGGYMVVRSL